MKNLLAAGNLQIAPGSGFTGFGPLGLVGTQASGADSTFQTFLSSAVGIMTLIAIIWFIFTFIIGAFGIITSGGDKQALEGARKKIINGLIGLVVVIIALFVINLIGYLLGIPDITNFQSMFARLTNSAAGP